MTTVASTALLLRATPMGESDLVVTFLLPEHGKVSAIARGGRASKKRFGGGLEAFHELTIVAETRTELWNLKEARIERPRSGILSSLSAIEHAGWALRFTRELCPPKAEERLAYLALSELLDATAEQPAAAERLLPGFALRLLAHMGYGLELGGCVRCGKAWTPGHSAGIDIARGGIMCHDCGGGARVLPSQVMATARGLLDGSLIAVESDAEARILLSLAHAMQLLHIEHGA